MTSLVDTFAALLGRVEDSEDYWRDIAVSDFAGELHHRMKALGVTHKDLAARMGTSRPYVTKLLSGGNFTLHTMVKLGMALDSVVRVRLEGREKRATERMPIDDGTVVLERPERFMGMARVKTVMDDRDAFTISAASGR